MLFSGLAHVRMGSKTKQKMLLLCLTCLQSFIEIGDTVQEISRHKQTKSLKKKNFQMFPFPFENTLDMSHPVFYASLLGHPVYRDFQRTSKSRLKNNYWSFQSSLYHYWSLIVIISHFSLIGQGNCIAICFSWYLHYFHVALHKVALHWNYFSLIFHPS